MIISTHSHLFTKPQGLDTLVGSGVFRQIWLLHTWYGYDDRHPGEPNGKATLDELLAVCRDYPGFFLPFGDLDFNKSPDYVDELYEKGCVGLKAIAPEKNYDDYSYFPFYERAAKYRMPIVFHTGGLGMSMQYVGPHRSFGQSTMKPSMLGPIARSFPELTLIGAHLGFPWMEETINTLNCRNVYFDMSEGNSEAIARWLMDNLDRRTVDDRPYTEKILFGVDARIGRPETNRDVLNAADFWKTFFHRFGHNHLWGRESEIEKIFEKNALSIQFPVH